MYVFKVFRGSALACFVPVSGSIVVKIHLVQGLMFLRITFPIFTQSHLSSS